MKRKSRKGSSSILVIMIVMALAVFGTFSIVSSLSGKKLANINTKFTKQYFDLKGESNEVVAFVSEIISNNKKRVSSTELVEQVSDKFTNTKNINAVYRNNVLSLNLEITPKEDFGNSHYLAVDYTGNEGEYTIVESKVMIKEIEIDDTEQFEIVE